MANLAGATMVTAQDLWTESSVQQHALGQLGVDKFGNRYRYVKNGAVALVTGNLLQEPAEDTQFVSMAVPSAVAIGSDEITVTNGTTTVTANMFKEGSLVISSGTGTGQRFNIVSHTTGVSGASITYKVDRPVKIALVAASSTVTVRKNPYNGVIAYPATTQTGAAVGVALYAMTIAYYGWIQSGGDAACLFDTGTNTSNGVTGVVPSAAVAGSVKPAAETDASSPWIGISRQVASVDSTHSIVHLFLD